ncbi:hypothetical protein [Paenibacillus cremeus]|nr:hypothetical protein [Paenibacillus cremeus]
MTDIHTVLQELKQGSASEFCAIAWADRDNRMLRWQAAAGNLNERYRQISFRSGQDLAGLVWRIGRPEALDAGTAGYERKRKESPIMLAEQLLAAAAFPISLQASGPGVLLVGSRALRLYTAGDLERISAEVGVVFGSSIGSGGIEGDALHW